MTIDQRAAAAQQGDGDAREQLFVYVLKRARLLASRHLSGRPEIDPEDVAMDIAWKVLKGLGKYDPKRPFSAWVTTVANRMCIDLYRSHAKQRDRFMPTGDCEETDQVWRNQIDPGAPDPSRGIACLDEFSSVLCALRRVPMKLRTALLLSVVTGLSAREISEHTGATVAATRFQITKGKQSFLAAHRRHRNRAAHPV